MKSAVLILCIMSGSLLLPVMAAESDASLLKWLRRSNAVYSPLEAAEYGTEKQLQEAVKVEPTQVNATDELGRTALHIAAANGKAGAVEILLDAGADAAACDANGKLPIEVAQGKGVVKLLETAGKVRGRELQLCRDIIAGNMEAVNAALKDGVNANALSEDKSGSLLCVAVMANNAEAVVALLQAGADANYVNDSQKSVLHMAASAASGEVIKALLAAGADPYHPGNNGATPLHDAVWGRNAAAVESLIPAYKADNFSPDGKRNGYPVSMTITWNRADFLQMFINAGIDVNDKRFAASPLLHQAVKHKRVFMVKMLLGAGADRSAKDVQGKTAIEYAAGEAYELLK